MTILTIIIHKKYVTITQDLLHKINCNRKNHTGGVEYLCPEESGQLRIIGNNNVCYEQFLLLFI